MKRFSLLNSVLISVALISPATISASMVDISTPGASLLLEATGGKPLQDINYGTESTTPPYPSKDIHS